MKYRKPIYISALLSMIFFAGCGEINTTDNSKSFEFWTGEKPGKDVQVVHAKYWQSSHFTKEYIVYFDLRTTPRWRNQFVKQNQLVVMNGQVEKPVDAPDWFWFSKDITWWRQTSGSSVYIQDNQTGHFFIYEEQL